MLSNLSMPLYFLLTAVVENRKRHRSVIFYLGLNLINFKGMPSREIQQLVHSCYGEELVITTDDENEDVLGCKSSSTLEDIVDTSSLLVCDLVESGSIGIDPQVSFYRWSFKLFIMGIIDMVSKYLVLNSSKLI